MRTPPFAGRVGACSTSACPWSTNVRLSDGSTMRRCGLDGTSSERRRPIPVTSTSGEKTGETRMSASDLLRITNVNVFDSVAGRIDGPFDVTVGDGTIAAVRPTARDALGGRRIDGTGTTLIPGLIDAHWHSVFTSVTAEVGLLGEAGYVFAHAVVSARETLMRGFTTVRDLGGPSFGIKQAIDEGSIPGPRIYPSGAFISQTGGHGDFRFPNEIPRGITGHLSYSEIIGAAVIA